MKRVQDSRCQKIWDRKAKIHGIGQWRTREKKRVSKKWICGWILFIDIQLIRCEGMTPQSIFCFFPFFFFPKNKFPNLILGNSRKGHTNEATLFWEVSFLRNHQSEESKRHLFSDSLTIFMDELFLEPKTTKNNTDKKKK